MVAIIVTDKKIGRGNNPNSRQNLSPRTPMYGETKKVHEVTVTEEAWAALKPVVKAAGCRSVSDLLEKLGRGELQVQPPNS